MSHNRTRTVKDDIDLILGIHSGYLRHHIHLYIKSDHAFTVAQKLGSRHGEPAGLHIHIWLNQNQLSSRGESLYIPWTFLRHIVRFRNPHGSVHILAVHISVYTGKSVIDGILYIVGKVNHILDDILMLPIFGKHLLDTVAGFLNNIITLRKKLLQDRCGSRCLQLTTDHDSLFG